MATSLGSLIVSLGLNAVEFVSGMSKAEFQANKALRSIQKDAQFLATTFKTVFGVIGVASVGAFAESLVSAAADLDDMAEKTGASVEELSKLSQQAFISGTALETVETTLIQLSKHLAGSGEESKNTTRALSALGLKAEELNNLDTAQALQIIAVELNKFQDGMGKAALATDLLGKAGAQALPFLKDLANDGAVAANVTAKQAAEAEELGKAWRRLMLDAKNLGQAIALDIVPWLRDLIEQFAKGIQIAGGFGEALRLFGLSTITKGNSADKIGEITTEIGKLQEKLADKRFAAPNWQSSINKQIDDAKKQLDFAKLLATQAETGGRRWDEEQGSPGAFKPALKYAAGGTTAAAKGADEAAKAADKYREMLVGLESQLRNVQGAETELQKIREKMAADKDFAKIPALQRDQLRTAIESVAAQIDAAKTQKEVNKGWVEHAEAVLAADEALLTYNASLVKSPKEHQALADSIRQTIDPTIRLKEELTAIDDLVKGGYLTEADKRFYLMDSRIRALLKPTQNLSDAIQQAWEAGTISTEEMQKAVNGVLDTMEQGETGAKDFAHAIGTSFEDAILKGEQFSDVLKGLLDDITRIALRMTVTKPLESQLENVFSKGLPALFGGFGGGGGAAAPAVNYGGNVGAGTLGGYATGTDYVPRTGPYLLHQGEAVIPAGQNGGGSIDARTYVDARGATQEAIPGIVAALNAQQKALERLASNDPYKRGGQARALFR